MFNTVSPEDRLGLVRQQHDEWRQQAVMDRGMPASSASRVTPEAEAEAPRHHTLQALRHLFHAPAWGHRSPRGMSH
jgi:hypothetical protein